MNLQQIGIFIATFDSEKTIDITHLHLLLLPSGNTRKCFWEEKKSQEKVVGFPEFFSIMGFYLVFMSLFAIVLS